MIAYLLYTQNFMDHDLAKYMVNDENVFFVMLYLAKFALDVLTYKAIGYGNAKEFTAYLFYLRISYDVLIICVGSFFMWWKSRASLGQSLMYVVPLFIIEPFIYFWSVRGAQKKI